MKGDISKSYQKVRYDLRPAKQVERLMLIDALRRLGADGFPITNYQYTGMGSVHFYDFSLLHRYAGINRMLSVEISESIRRRVKFNRPFKRIGIEIGPVGSAIPNLSKTLQHLLWLDYDSTIQSSYVADVAQAVSHFKAGSIILVTVDVGAPKGTNSTPEIKEHYEAELDELLPQGLKPVNFTPKNLSAVNAAILWRAIQRGLSGREGLSFQSLFNFIYQDGHRMLTVGGMLVNEEMRQRLRTGTIMEAPYVRKSFSQRHYSIVVPVFTRKERIYLDAEMPCLDGWKPRHFEASKGDLMAYRNIYQFSPQFAELII